MTRRGGFLSVFVVAATIAVLIVFLFYSGYLRLNYPDAREFPVMGIDISHHQGVIDWKSVRNEGVDFVYIKATEGGDFRDPMFHQNWINSKREGYQTGAYHFYRFCRNGKEQAENFIGVVPKDTTSLPPVIDLEFGGNCSTDKSKEQILKEIGDFLAMLEGYYNKRPVIYATAEFYESFLVNHFTDYPLWIRNIYGRPDLPHLRKWAIWQYANRGHLDGIEGFVDLNVLNGNSFSVFD